jgi:hypothetical protein
LTFPDLPRLELDQLLGQLVERAQEVMASQGRLRGLLRACQVVIGDLTLPVLLRRIVEAARELVGARYAALGVISPAGGLAEFVHVGMSAGTVERIGHLPQGKGLLGALIEDPRPIRLSARTASRRTTTTAQDERRRTVRLVEPAPPAPPLRGRGCRAPADAPSPTPPGGVRPPGPTPPANPPGC